MTKIAKTGKKLILSKETVRKLTTEELQRVRGGENSVDGGICSDDNCPTAYFTCKCLSLLRLCTIL